MRQGALVGLPPSYFAKSKADLSGLTQASGFRNFLGKTIDTTDLDEKLDDSTRNRLDESLVLSNDAKLFGLMRQLVSTNNFLISQCDKLVDLFALVSAYWFSYTRTRSMKLQLGQRRMVYLVASLFAGCIIVGSRMFVQKYVETIMDTGKEKMICSRNYDSLRTQILCLETCRLGLDCCEGSIEYFDKLIERNKILRQVLPDGPKLIDADGNYLVNPFQVPLTNSYVYLKNDGKRLQDRKRACEQELTKMVVALTGSSSSSSSSQENVKTNDDSNSSAAGLTSTNPKSNENDTEWEIFKKIRLFLEQGRKK